LAASSRGGPCATAGRAERLRALGSSRDSAVFAAISADWPIYWPCGRRGGCKIPGVWRFGHQEGITSCNNDISFLGLTPSALYLLMLMVRKKSRFREEDDCGRKKGRRLKKRSKIQDFGRK
jgi:hypothetical protein